MIRKVVTTYEIYPMELRRLIGIGPRVDVNFVLSERQELIVTITAKKKWVEVPRGR